MFLNKGHNSISYEYTGWEKHTGQPFLLGFHLWSFRALAYMVLQLCHGLLSVQLVHFHLFVSNFARVDFVLFSLPLGVMGWLRRVIVILPGLFYNFLRPGGREDGIKGWRKKEQKDKAKSICPADLFKVGGIISIAMLIYSSHAVEFSRCRKNSHDPGPW